MKYDYFYNNSCGCDYYCIPGGDIIPALRETFIFIKNHPTNLEGQEYDCGLLLKVSLLKSQDNETSSNSEVATNTVYGQIKKVHKTFVEISYPSIVNEEIAYTISYQSILSLVSPSLINYYNQYIKFMDRIPHICKDNDDSNYSLLKDLNIFLKDEAIVKNYSLVFILSGVLTREYSLDNVITVGNLIFAENTYIIPITEISGYVSKPRC